MKAIILFFAFIVSAAAGQEVGTLDRYAACKLPNGPDVVETAPLAAGVHTRTVTTLQGSRSIAMEQGTRIMFAYPGEEFYSNVKAERLPAATYSQEKGWLIDEFEYILSGKGDNRRNYVLKSKLNGFEIYGLDRGKLEGGVLGMYLFFDDLRHEVVTIYFLNQDPEKRFTTIKEYEKTRTQFIESYTSCLSKK